MTVIILKLRSDDFIRIEKADSLENEVIYDQTDTALKINLNSRKVYENKREILLTKIEFDILVYLATYPDRVFTYQQIYESVWGEPYYNEKGNIMTHIRHLREKIEPDPSHPQYIENVRGVGYRFKKQ